MGNMKDGIGNLLKAADSISSNLAEKLSDMYEHDRHKQWGYRSFMEFCRHLDVEFRTAMFLISLHSIKCKYIKNGMVDFLNQVRFRDLWCIDVVLNNCDDRDEMLRRMMGKSHCEIMDIYNEFMAAHPNLFDDDKED